MIREGWTTVRVYHRGILLSSLRNRDSRTLISSFWTINSPSRSSHNISPPRASNPSTSTQEPTVYPTNLFKHLKTSHSNVNPQTSTTSTGRTPAINASRPRNNHNTKLSQGPVPTTGTYKTLTSIMTTTKTQGITVTRTIWGIVGRWVTVGKWFTSRQSRKFLIRETQTRIKDHRRVKAIILMSMSWLVTMRFISRQRRFRSRQRTWIR